MNDACPCVVIHHVLYPMYVSSYDMLYVGDKPSIFFIGLPQGAAIFTGLVILDKVFGSSDEHHGHGHGDAHATHDTHDTHEKHEKH